MTDEELKAKLLEVENGKGSGDYTSNWHRNPEGPQAVARIEELEAWKLAVDHRLVSAFCKTADSYDTAEEAVDDLINQEIALSCDPLINGGTDDE